MGKTAAECRECRASKLEAGYGWVAPARSELLSGILNVDKPAGMTSHDVVDVVRRLSGQRKVGHAGTLDPMATGVLVVCLGRATRLVEYLMPHRKRYRADIVFGTETDTYDLEGSVVSTGHRADFSNREIVVALSSFHGSIAQVPPAYSAIKQHGQPLHRLARMGLPVERRPRVVEVDSISVLNWMAPTLTIEVQCGPGTYIRSLAHDLGRYLSSAAYLASLVRLASGQFALEDAVSLDRLEEAFRHGRDNDYLVPMDEALLDWPACILSAGESERVIQGQSLPESVQPDSGKGAALCRAYDLAGEFVAILQFDSAAGHWLPKKVFPPMEAQAGIGSGSTPLAPGHKS